MFFYLMFSWISIFLPDPLWARENPEGVLSGILGSDEKSPENSSSKDKGKNLSKGSVSKGQIGALDPENSEQEQKKGKKKGFSKKPRKGFQQMHLDAPILLKANHVLYKEIHQTKSFSIKGPFYAIQNNLSLEGLDGYFCQHETPPKESGVIWGKNTASRRPFFCLSP
jgi:hypothetical protein